MDSGGGSALISIDILTPAVTYPGTLPRGEIISTFLKELCLTNEDCQFYDIDNTRIACLLKNNSK